MATKQKEKAAKRAQKRNARGPFAKLIRLRMSPRKVRLVVDLVRGKGVDEALSLLAFCPKRAAKPVSVLIKSAIANADEAEGYDVDRLFVKSIFVDEGPTWRRWLPRAMGRAYRIHKRSSHVSVELGQR